MTRVFSAGLCLLALLFLPLSARGATSERPNILFCIADDWSWPHAGALGDKAVRTPNIDRLAARGMVLNRAFCAAPSCTPSRGAILTGKYPHQLEQGGNLWSFLPRKFAVVPDLLERNGYSVGMTGKGWGPGNFRAGGRERNPAGPQFRSFDQFLATVPAGKPFWFWFGSQDPHRPYERGAGASAGLNAANVEVPQCWPDSDAVRQDMLDYYFEVERFDRDVGKLVALLEEKSLLKNTVIVVTGDNGLPFPRAKANLYDLGTRVPLIVAWPGKVREKSVSDAFVNLADLGPTFLEIAGLKPLPEMSARSLLPLLEGREITGFAEVFLERERHANVRKGDLSYPSRAIRTDDFLYIHNFRPERWPAGDPEMYKAVGPYGDCDNSPTKTLILEQPATAWFRLAFSKRPAEELYHLREDPAQTNNVAGDPRFRGAKQNLATRLEEWMRHTHDPRVDPDADPWSEYVYFGGGEAMPASTAQPNGAKK